jgi:hypothetical protein
MKLISDVEQRQPVDQPEELGAPLPDTIAAVTEQPAGERAAPDFGYDRLEKALHALGGGLARLKRKLDRILALCVESRGRHRQ